MELWIPVTIAAALLQTWRTALQQKLRGALSVNAAGFVRYVYALPTGALLVAGFHLAAGAALPAANHRFLLLCALGGFLQILGTNLLIMAFGFRSFVVGSAYAKTESVQGAILAFLLLHEALTKLAVLGIAIGVAGVLVLSLAGRGLRAADMLRATLQPAALSGLGAGAAFALTTICVKAANQALGTGGDVAAIVRQAVFVLLVTNILQTLMQGAYLALREPDQLIAAFRTWRSSAWVGTLSACGSACWFTGFALAPVALVRSVGQVEMVSTVLFARFFLKEGLRRVDVVGLALIVAGVLLILWAR